MFDYTNQLAESIECDQQINRLLLVDRALTMRLNLMLQEYSTYTRMQDYLSRNGDINVVAHLYDLDAYFPADSIYGKEDWNSYNANYVDEQKKKTGFIHNLLKIWRSIVTIIQQIIPWFGQNLITLATRANYYKEYLDKHYPTSNAGFNPLTGVNYSNIFNNGDDALKKYDGQQKIVDFGIANKWCEEVSKLLDAHGNRIDKDLMTHVEHVAIPEQSESPANYTVENLKILNANILLVIDRAYVLQDYLKDEVGNAKKRASELKSNNMSEDLINNAREQIKLAKENLSLTLKVTKKLPKTIKLILDDVLFCLKYLLKIIRFNFNK